MRLEATSTSEAVILCCFEARICSDIMDMVTPRQQEFFKNADVPVQQRLNSIKRCRLAKKAFCIKRKGFLKMQPENPWIGGSVCKDYSTAGQRKGAALN